MRRWTLEDLYPQLSRCPVKTFHLFPCFCHKFRLQPPEEFWSKHSTSNPFALLCCFFLLRIGRVRALNAKPLLRPNCLESFQKCIKQDFTSCADQIPNIYQAVRRLMRCVIILPFFRLQQTENSREAPGRFV